MADSSQPSLPPQKQARSLRLIARPPYLSQHWLPDLEIEAVKPQCDATYAGQERGEEGAMFRKILHANDGSDHAFHALSLALALAKQDKAELHMVSVEEIPYLPETIEEVREETGVAARRFHTVVNRARTMADESGVKLNAHVLAGHPVRDIVDLARDLNADLLVVGGSGHSALYGRLIGSRADRIVHLAPCPVLVVK